MCVHTLISLYIQINNLQVFLQLTKAQERNLGFQPLVLMKVVGMPSMFFVKTAQWQLTQQSNVSTVVVAVAFNSWTILYSGTDVSTQGYGRGERPVWLEDVTCTGIESTIIDCRYQRLGSSAYVCPNDLALGVNCGPPPGNILKEANAD